MVSKSIIFLVKSFLGNFYRHLAIFIWSHWLAFSFENLLFFYTNLLANLILAFDNPLSDSNPTSDINDGKFFL